MDEGKIDTYLAVGAGLVFLAGFVAMLIAYDLRMGE